MRRLVSNQAGATLVESMVAFVLLAGTMVAVYPIFAQLKRHGKSGDVRQFCENVVRAKLEEYRSGHLVRVSDAANGTAGTDYAGLAAMPKIDDLSMPTLSQSSVGAIGAGGPGTAGGFMYAKVRYNRFFPFACNGQSNAALFQQAGYLASNGAAPILGMRECIGSNTVLSNPNDPAGIPAAGQCNTLSDSQAQKEMPGFKLYVKLELDTSWPVPQANPGTTTGSVAKDTQFGAFPLPPAAAGAPAKLLSCPNFGSYGFAPPAPLAAPLVAPLYDFDGAGDGIRVTVTGVLDFLSLGGATRAMGEIQAAATDRLMCSVSATIRPEAYPVRYYLSRGGRIYSVHGHGLNGQENGGWVLPSLYGQGGSLQSGITSIAVHPRNLSIYVLRPGSLTRYSNCGGVPLDCRTTVNPTQGISDGGLANWPSVQEWLIPSNIQYIGVDFRNNRFYGFTGDRTQFYEIWNNAAKTSIANCAACGLASPSYVETLGTTQASGFRMPPATATWPFRLTGFFVNPEGDEGFISDLTTRTNIAGGGYSASVYRILDTQLAQPVVTLPLDAVSFSD